MSSHPDLADPSCWERVSIQNPDNYPFMSCHWSDVKRGYVVPKYNGQVFYFVDLNEMRAFRGLPDPQPELYRSTWPTRIVIALFLIFFGVDLWLVWVLFDRLEWL